MKEGKKLEYKQEVTDSFLKTVSAYANYDGGDIVFGIADDGTHVGLEHIDAQCLSIENKVSDSISPKPEFTMSVGDKNRTITLHVEAGSHPPYCYKKKAYRRSGTSTVEVDDIELRRLVLRGEHLDYEALRSDRQDLTFDYLEGELARVLGVRSLSSDLLKTLSLYSDQDGFNKAAAMLSDQNDFPGVDIARFGETMSIFLDRETWEGESLLGIYDKSIGMFERHYSYEEVTGAKRERLFSIPHEAFREALANAIVHRTWDVNARVRVSMFDDRVEVSSPGGLPHGLSEEEYLNGQVSVFRNPILCSVFYRLNIIETFGTGVLKIKQAYEGRERKPQFKIFDNSLTVVLPTQEGKAALSSDEQAIRDFLAGGRLASSSEIAAATGFSKAKTVQKLNSMVEKNAIRREGTGRGTKYRL